MSTVTRPVELHEDLERLALAGEGWTVLLLGDRVVTPASCTALHVAVAALDVLRAQEAASRG